MDNELISNAQENVPVSAVDDDHDAILSYPPFRFNFQNISHFTFSLRAFAPKIIPVLICITFIPLVILLSFSAGFFVWKNVAVGWESPLYLQFGDGSLPYASATVSSLVPQQSYDISVHLDIPAVENNFALGNFMTTLTLSTPSNKTLTSARRTAIVFPPKTSVFYRNPGTIRVVIPMVSSFVTSSSTIVAYVEIGRQDQWKSLGTGEGREVSVITASVQGSVVRGGLRGLVSRFPLSFALMSTFAFLVIMTIILAGCILTTMFRRKPRNIDTDDVRDAEDDEIATPSPSASEVDAKPSMRHKGKSKPSRSRSARTKFKRESPTSSRDPTRITSVRRRILRPSGGLANSDQDM